MNTSLLIKYSNLAFFVIASVLFFALFPHDKITQEVLDLFPKTKDREVIDIYREFANSHYVFVANKGFEAESKQELAAFLARVQTLPNVKTTLTHTQIPEALQEFIAKHYTIMAFPRQDMPALSPQNITQQILQGIESKTLNPYDPLNAFSMPSSTPQEFVAKDYGYVGLVELKSLENADIKTTIEGFTAIAKDFPTIRYFSQNFMDTINLELILHEVSFLLTFASVVFVVLYFVIIRIPMLTLNTIATLVFANIVAMFVVANVYADVHMVVMLLFLKNNYSFYYEYIDF